MYVVPAELQLKWNHLAWDQFDGTETDYPISSAIAFVASVDLFTERCKLVEIDYRESGAEGEEVREEVDYANR